MGKGRHKCHWILESNVKGWALGRCKWCSRVEAFDNFPKYGINGSIILSNIQFPNQTKRDFLRSQGVMVSYKKWSKKEKWILRESVKKIGVTATAKKYNVPKQNLSLWFKGLTPYKYNPDKYTDQFRMEVGKYAEDIDNNYRTAKKFKVSRSSVQNWRSQYTYDRRN